MCRVTHVISVVVRYGYDCTFELTAIKWSIDDFLMPKHEIHRTVMTPLMLSVIM
jgi:hypothetical protein